MWWSNRGSRAMLSSLKLKNTFYADYFVNINFVLKTKQATREHNLSNEHMNKILLCPGRTGALSSISSSKISRPSST